MEGKSEKKNRSDGTSEKTDQLKERWMDGTAKTVAKEIYLYDWRLPLV